MADEPKATQGEDSEEGPKKGGIKGMLTKLPVLVGGAMAVEAAVLIGVFLIFSGGPAEADAHGDDGHGEVEYDDHGNPLPAADHGEMAEVEVGKFRAPNRLNGRTYVFDVEIGVRVKGDVAEKVAAKLEASQSLVKDRMNYIIASIDPQKLNGAAEPGLETLRRQVKYRLDLIVGEGLIEEVLVPRCMPYRTDY